MRGRLLALTVLIGAFGLAGGTPAYAADQPGLQIAVRGTDPAKPMVVLTNRGDKACEVATSGVGTLGLTKVVQDGKLVEPVGVDAFFVDPPSVGLTERLRVLEPGKSVEFPIRTVKGGPTGLAIETVTWSPSTGGYGLIYPLAAGKPVAIEAAYALPLQGDGKAPLCGPAAGNGQAAGGDSADTRKWILWAAIGAAVLLLLLLLLVVLIRKRKQKAAAAVLMVLAILGMSVQSRPAHADFDVTDPSMQGALDGCMAEFNQPGHDPAGLLPWINGMHIRIYPADIGESHTDVLNSGEAWIFWSSDDHHRYAGTGGNADPCTTLYHEFSHAAQGANGTYSRAPCATPDGGSLEQTEVQATRDQNLLRAILGMPERSHYGDTPLPEGDCRAPEDAETCEGPSCADSNGDPHLLTYDRLRYDFQAVGEFVLSKGDGFEIQTRQEPAAGARDVSLNTAVAMKVGSDRIEARQTPAGPEVLVNGQVKPMPVHESGVEADVREIVVTWPNQAKAFIRAIGRWGFRVSVQPSPEQAGKLQGLLGDNDGESKNDLKVNGGSTLTEPKFDSLYPAYADSWRITQEQSLFTYLPGRNTASYVDKTFPDKPIDPATLPGRDAAEALCRQQGVVDEAVLSGCIIDVVRTGQPDFAASAAEGQHFVGTDFGGEPFQVKLAKVGETATVEFQGTAGQQIFVDVPNATLPSGCGVLDLHGPDGKVLSSGCVIGGRGYIDSTTLPAGGKYTVTVGPSEKPGQASLRVLTIKDQVSPIIEGQPLVVRLDKPGMVGKLSFTGRKGQKVFVDATRSTLPSQCGVLRLLDPTGREIISGCVVSGSGEIDGIVLPADGGYTVIVDPADRNVGDVTLKLVNVTDQRAGITLDSPVVAKIAQPGGEVFLTFAGTAGQRVFIVASDSSLPSQCGILDLKLPSGGSGPSGCVVTGKGGILEDEGYLLPETGAYTIVVDPNGDAIGQVTIKIHT